MPQERLLRLRIVISNRPLQVERFSIEYRQKKVISLVFILVLLRVEIG